jgi:vacuolar-type H+-ATPase subunit F/Vma7
MSGYGVRVLCRPEIAAGFSLAGLATLEAATLADGTRQVEDLMNDPQLGVVLVENVLYDGFPDELRRRIGRRPLPMVVPFPGPAWAARPEEAETYIVELLRQVIGYRVRLR